MQRVTHRYAVLHEDGWRECSDKMVEEVGLALKQLGSLFLHDSFQGLSISCGDAIPGLGLTPEGKESELLTVHTCIYMYVHLYKLCIYIVYVAKWEVSLSEVALNMSSFCPERWLKFKFYHSSLSHLPVPKTSLYHFFQLDPLPFQ